MRMPKYFYFTVDVKDHGTRVELTNRSDADVVEVIRCKDCKHSEHWYRDKRRCFLWYEDGIDVFDDGFCNYAERKEE